MAERPTPTDLPHSPEPIRFQEGLVGLQTRLLIATPEALNQNHMLPAVTRDALGSFADRNYGVFNNASIGERRDHWRGKEGDVFDRQKAAWIQSTVSTFTNDQAKQFFQTEKGKQWSETFGKLGINTQQFTQESAEQLYSTYFTEGKSDIKKFVKDCLEKNASQDLSAIQWLANIFGTQSSEVVAQLIDAEKKLKAQPEQLIEEANHNQRLNHLEEREDRLLEFLSGIRKEPAQTTSQETSQNLEVDEDLVTTYKVFQDTLHPKTDLVYYPACNVDISPSKGFPNSRVIYVDINNEAVAALKKAGLEAYNQSALEYKPDNPVDVLILQNPSISHDVPSQHVAQGGYVLCNDYHRTATDLRGDKDFELVGIIKKQGDRDYILDQDNPDDYWKQVDSDEELQRIDPYSYKQIAEYAQKIWGIDQNIVQGHKKLLDLIKDDPNQAKQLLMSKLGVSSVSILDDGEVLMTSSDGRTLILPVLPRKKGHMDDTFVFKRISKQSEIEETAQDERIQILPQPKEQTLSSLQETDPRRAKSFKTAQGSVYTYDQDGKTTRFKTATGEPQARQDLTVFVDLTPDESQEFLHAYHHVRKEDKNSKIYILERQPDNTPKILRDISEVQYQDRIYLSIVKNGVATSIKKASVKPVIGHHVFDTRQYHENGQTMTERHLGNKVVDIQYESN